jgi:hypothetical protein
MPAPDEQIFRKSASRLKTERASHERAVIRERALQLAPIFQSEGLGGMYKGYSASFYSIMIHGFVYFYIYKAMK